MYKDLKKLPRGGYTLLELLFLIAIIVVLIGILIPVISNVNYTSRSLICLSEKRQVMAGLLAYANINDGSFPWKAIGTGALYNPHDHNCFKMREIRKLGVPYGMWLCAADKTTLDERSRIVESEVNANVADGSWKWNKPGAITYWIEQGGGDVSSRVYDKSPADNISSRYLATIPPSTVILADFLNFANPNVPDSAVHTRRGRTLHSLVACVDGHVEQRDIKEASRRFFNFYAQGY